MHSLCKSIKYSSLRQSHAPDSAKVCMGYGILQVKKVGGCYTMMQLLICKAQLSKETWGEPNTRASFSDSSSNFECEHQPSANHNKRSCTMMGGLSALLIGMHAMSVYFTMLSVPQVPIEWRSTFYVIHWCATLWQYGTGCPPAWMYAPLLLWHTIKWQLSR